MAQDEDERDLLELFKFELKFVADGGYGRSPHTPWRRPFIFEDSPTCLNFRDPGRPHACNECRLMRFVPAEFRNQASPCRFIPLNRKGETIDYFYRCGTQVELEESLAGWLRNQISRIEGDIEGEQEQPPNAEQDQPARSRLDPLRRKQWLAFAGNLYALANRHRENHNYVVANALYSRALEAAGKVAGEDDGVSLATRIRRDRQAVFEMLRHGQKAEVQASPEELQLVGR